MGLLNWQKQFKENILQDQITKQFSDQFSSDPSRLNIYKNNVFYSLTEALSAQYPNVKKLVGESFFNACCRQFIKIIDSNKAEMIFVGEKFPEFLSNFEHRNLQV